LEKYKDWKAKKLNKKTTQNIEAKIKTTKKQK